jgi:prevent-host-death family protein
MARYKQHGDMLVVDPRPKAVEEVSVRELSRETSSVLARVKAGGRIVVTKHGVPAAVVLEVDEAIGLCGLMLLSRMEAQRRLFGPELDARLRGRIMRRRPRDLEWRKRRRFRA